MAVNVKRGGSPEKIDQHVIVVESTPAQIETADVSKWKSAVNSAKHGYTNQLYRLYENLMSDGVFSRAINKRIEAITNAELIFKDANGDPVKEVMDMIDTPEFEYLLQEIMDAKAWGVSVIDITRALPFDCYSVPRRNINAIKKMILANEYADTGMDYSTNPYIFEVKEKRDPLGFIYKAAPYIIYKRGGFGDWAEFVEVFGMPFKLGSYSAYDTATRDALLAALKMAGSAPYMVKPKEADIEFIEAKSNSNGDLYDRFLDRCDKEILISVLGQTMTTIDGSSKSQSETHKDVEEDINKSDRKFVRRVLNRSVLPILEMSGLPVKGGVFDFPEQGESLTTKERVEIAIQIKNNGVPVSDDYLYEVSGVRKPEDGETVSMPNAVNPVNDPNQLPDAGKAVKAQASFTERLSSFFREALAPRAPLKF